MLKVGITGNIAAGKSTVEKMLRENGLTVLDTDEVAHDLLLDDDVKKVIVNAFKGLDILQDGELSRPKLAKIIFTNKDHRTTLESILHPLIRKQIERFFRSFVRPSDRVAFVSVPLLFEAKFDDLFDKIVLVYAEDDIRIKRLVERNDLTEEMAKNRMNIQMSQDKKIPLAAHIVFNNGSIQDLQTQVQSLVEDLV